MALIKKDFDFEPQTLGEHIKKKRLELGLTQKQAGRRLGVDEGTWRGWEKGTTVPRLRYVRLLERFSAAGHN